jgi:coenzyme F420 hydrogenase subunit beta
MTWNRYGEYVPSRRAVCRPAEKGCGRCVASCPALADGWDCRTLLEPVFDGAPEVRYQEPIGFWREAFMGYRRELADRVQCASGGLLSATLEMLLRQGWVDGVFCVAPAQSPARRFEYRLVTNLEELADCRGSAYYPGEISQAVRTILQQDLRYAVVGLPCVCRGLRRAMGLDKRLRARVRVLLGLTCGQNKSRGYCDYLCCRAGLNPEEVTRVNFRGKHPSRPAWNFTFRCEDSQGRVNSLAWKDAVEYSWIHRFFTLPVCGWCDDVFAESADAVFMDAWLPGLQEDWRGHSLAVVRSGALGHFKELLSPVAHLEPVPLAQVFQSQLGVVDAKRSEMRTRIRQAERLQISPGLSADPVRHLDWAFGKGPSIAAHLEATHRSRELWQQCGGDLIRFEEGMRPTVLRIQRAQQWACATRHARSLLRRFLMQRWAW